MSRNGVVVRHVCPYLRQGYRECRCSSALLFEYRQGERVVQARDEQGLAALLPSPRERSER